MGDTNISDVEGVGMFGGLLCWILDHKPEVLFEALEQIILPDGVTHLQERHIVWHVKKCSRCGKEDWEKTKDKSVGRIVKRRSSKWS